MLNALDNSPIRTQMLLADAIGADKTRIIPTLDELQHRGYIHRRPDPGDRRVRLLEITESGRQVKDAVKFDIQRAEQRWLLKLTTQERSVFLRALERLSQVRPPSDDEAIQ